MTVEAIVSAAVGRGRHRSRTAILQTLSQGPLCVSEIIASTGLSQANVSAHLSRLRQRGLVSRMWLGRLAIYSLTASVGDPQVASLSGSATRGKVAGERTRFAASSIGAQLRARRQAAGLTQSGLARAAGIGRITLVRIEGGDQRPRRQTLEVLLRTLRQCSRQNP